MVIQSIKNIVNRCGCSVAVLCGIVIVCSSSLSSWSSSFVAVVFIIFVQHNMKWYEWIDRKGEGKTKKDWNTEPIFPLKNTSHIQQDQMFEYRLNKNPCTICVYMWFDLFLRTYVIQLIEFMVLFVVVVHFVRHLIMIWIFRSFVYIYKL